MRKPPPAPVMVSSTCYTCGAVYDRWSTQPDVHLCPGCREIAERATRHRFRQTYMPGNPPADEAAQRIEPAADDCRFAEKRKEQGR